MKGTVGWRQVRNRGAVRARLIVRETHSEDDTSHRARGGASWRQGGVGSMLDWSRENTAGGLVREATSEYYNAHMLH